MTSLCYDSSELSSGNSFTLAFPQELLSALAGCAVTLQIEFESQQADGSETEYGTEVTCQIPAYANTEARSIGRVVYNPDNKTIQAYYTDGSSVTDMWVSSFSGDAENSPQCSCGDSNFDVSDMLDFNEQYAKDNGETYQGSYFCVYAADSNNVVSILVGADDSSYYQVGSIGGNFFGDPSLPSASGEYTVVKDGGTITKEMFIGGGEKVCNVKITGRNAELFVGDNGFAEDVYVTNYAEITFEYDGIGKDIVVSSTGAVEICGKWADVTNCFVEKGGWVNDFVLTQDQTITDTLNNGFTLNNVKVEVDEEAEIYDGMTVTNVTMGGKYSSISIEGGILDTVTVGKDMALYLQDCDITLKNITMTTGSYIVFEDCIGTNKEDAILDDWSAIKGASYAEYIVTLPTYYEGEFTPVTGMHKLAANAEGFDGMVSLYKEVHGDDDTLIGTMYLWRQGAYYVDGYTYSINKVGSDLYLYIESGDYSLLPPDSVRPVVGKISAKVEGTNVEILLNGNDNDGVFAYRLEMYGEVIDTVEADSQGNTRYNYEAVRSGKHDILVYAIDGMGNVSAKSGKVSFTVKDVFDPVEVTKFNDTVVDAKYNGVLSWEAVTDDDPNGKVTYEIRLNGDDSKIYKSTKNSYKASNLTVGKHYYQVRAVDKAGNKSEWSKEQDFEVKDVTAPTLGRLSAKVKGKDVTISLNGKDNVGVVAYRLKMYGEVIDTVKADPQGNAVYNYEAERSGKHDIQVYAIDKAGNETAKPGKVSFTVKDFSAPGIVETLNEVDITKYTGVFSWEAVKDDSGLAVTYEIRLNGDDSKIYKSTKNSYKASNLTVGKHYYQVRAVDKAGNRSDDWSDEKEFTVKGNGEEFSFKAAAGINSEGKLVISTDRNFSSANFELMEVEFHIKVGNKTLYMGNLELAPSEVLSAESSRIFEMSIPENLLTLCAGKTIQLKIEFENDTLDYEYSTQTTLYVPTTFAETPPVIDFVSYDEATGEVTATFADGSQVNELFVTATSGEFERYIKGSGGSINVNEIIEDIKQNCKDEGDRYTGITICVGSYSASNLQVIHFTASGSVQYLKSEIASFPVSVNKALDIWLPSVVEYFEPVKIDTKYNGVLSWESVIDDSGTAVTYEIMLDEDDSKIYKSTKNSYKTGKLSVGEHTYRVRAVDKAGNRSDWSAEQFFEVKDVTAPTLGRLSAKVDGKDVTISLNGKDNVGVVKYRLEMDGEVIDTVYADSQGNAEYNYEAVRSGKHDIQVYAIDEADNETAKPGKVSFTVKDFTAPDIVGTPNEVDINKYTGVFSWKAVKDDSGLAVTYEIMLNGDDSKIYKSTKNSYKASNLTVGENYYQVRAVDKAGNKSEWSDEQEFFVTGDSDYIAINASAYINGSGKLVINTDMGFSTENCDMISLLYQVKVGDQTLFIGGTNPVLPTDSTQTLEVSLPSTLLSLCAGKTIRLRLAFEDGETDYKAFPTVDIPVDVAGTSSQNFGEVSYDPETGVISAELENGTVVNELFISATCGNRMFVGGAWNDSSLNIKDMIANMKAECREEGEVYNGATFCIWSDSASDMLVLHIAANGSYEFLDSDISSFTASQTLLTAAASTGSDTTPPADVWLIGTANADSIDLSWDESSDDVALAGYELSYSKDGGEFETLGLLSASTTSYQITDFDRSSDYEFRIAAVDTSNNFSEYSSVKISMLA